MKKLLITLLVLLPFIGSAQDTYTLKFLPQLQQSQWFNATNQPDAKISIGLPVLSSFSFYIYNSGFTYHDMFSKVGDTALAVHMGSFIDKLKDKNYIGFGASYSLFSACVSLKQFTVGLSVNDRMDVQFNYPKDMFKLLWYGNGAYLGKTLEIGNFGINASYYREYALHAAVNYNKWTFGISPKLLYGKANINTKETSVKLYTDPAFYDLTATANINIQTSGIPDSNDNKNGFLNSGEKVRSYFFNTQNKGYGVDLGVKYNFTKNLSLAAGINDLGYINWNSTIHNYTAHGNTFTFDGLHADNYFQGDSNIVSATKIVDTIKKLIKYDKNSEVYSTTLPYEVYGMVNYRLKHHWFGLNVTAKKFSDDWLYAGTLSYQLKFGRHFTGALTYTAKSNAAFNIGGALILQFFHMQWYLATDNWYAAVKPLDSKNMNVNMGMNIVFGRRMGKTLNEEPEPAEEEETTVEEVKQKKFW